MYKQRFKQPSNPKTPKLNYIHIGYIATRPHAMKNENGEHALFGKLDLYNTCESRRWQDTARFIRRLSENKTNIYRSVISLKRSTSNELRLLTQRDWQEYAERHIRTLAEKNNILLQNLGWCGAFHNEGAHPHLHIVFWDNKQEIQSNYTNPKIADQIRVELIKTTFEVQIKEFYEGKQHAKAEIASLSDEMVSEFDEYMKNIYPKEFKILQAQFEKYSDSDDKLLILEFFNNNEQLFNLTEKLFAIRAALPKNGRINYGLLPPDVKKMVDDITDELLNDNTYLQNAVNKYVDVLFELKELYISNPDNLADYKEKCSLEAKKQISNRILKSVKAIISKETEVKTDAIKQHYATECMVEILTFFAREIVTNSSMIEDKKSNYELSERAAKEWYLKNKDREMEF